MKNKIHHRSKAEIMGHLFIILLGGVVFYLCNVFVPESPALAFSVHPMKMDTLPDVKSPKPLSFPSKMTSHQDSALPIRSAKEPAGNVTYHIDSIDFEDLIRIGLPKKLAYTWTNYLEAGGKIQRLEDVERLYGMTSEHLRNLKDKVVFHRSTPSIKKLVDINTAKPSDLRSLKGIGEVLSNRIVKFRDKLGGFVSLDQVAETYGVSDSLMATLKQWITITPIEPTLKINETNVETLAKHPYISWKQAKIIIRYRNEHGPFISVDDLRKTKILDSSWISRVNPYIDLELETMKE